VVFWERIDASYRMDFKSNASVFAVGNYALYSASLFVVQLIGYSIPYLQKITKGRLKVGRKTESIK